MSGRFVFVLIVMCVLPSGAVEAQARVAEAPAQRWGIDIWGLSYHVNRQSAEHDVDRHRRSARRRFNATGAVRYR